MFKVTPYQAFAATLILSLAVGCSSAPKIVSPQRPWQKSALKGYTEKSIEAFGTKFVFRAWPSKTLPTGAPKAIDQAIAEVRRIVRLADGEVEGGEVNLVNASAYKQAIPISTELASILIQCDRMYKVSEQRFDVTHVLYKQNMDDVGEGDFNRITDWDTQDPPGPKALRLFGEKNVILDTMPHRVRFYNQRLKLNLRGMVRGYAAERAARTLKAQGLDGFAVMIDGFTAAFGTAFNDPSLMCIENPAMLGSCLYRIKPSNPAQILYFANSPSNERSGKIYDEKEVWSFRSGGVVVAGETGYWVQFAATITSLMSDSVLIKFFKNNEALKISAVYFLKEKSGILKGSLEPYALHEAIVKK